MRVYVTAIAGRRDIEVAVYGDRGALEATGDFEPANIDSAEIAGRFVDASGGSLIVADVTAPAAWSVVATWSEPEEGTAAYGPYASAAEAATALERIEADFLNDGDLPDDVEFGVLEMIRPGCGPAVPQG